MRARATSAIRIRPGFRGEEVTPELPDRAGIIAGVSEDRPLYFRRMPRLPRLLAKSAGAARHAPRPAGRHGWAPGLRSRSRAARPTTSMRARSHGSGRAERSSGDKPAARHPHRWRSGHDSAASGREPRPKVGCGLPGHRRGAARPGPTWGDKARISWPARQAGWCSPPGWERSRPAGPVAMSTQRSSRPAGKPRARPCTRRGRPPRPGPRPQKKSAARADLVFGDLQRSRARPPVGCRAMMCTCAFRRTQRHELASPPCGRSERDRWLI
jgi:hypothetical protein